MVGGKGKSEYRKTEAAARRRAEWWRARIAGEAAPDVARTAQQTASAAQRAPGDARSAGGWLARLAGAADALSAKLAEPKVSAEEAAIGAKALAELAKAARPLVELASLEGPQADASAPADDGPGHPLSDVEIVERLVTEAGPEMVAQCSRGRLAVIDGGKAATG